MAARDDTINRARVRHEQAVARTLDWSDQAAEDGDDANALTWLQALEAIGGPLSSDCLGNARHGDGRCVLIAPNSNTSRRDREHGQRGRSRRRCTSALVRLAARASAPRPRHSGTPRSR